MIDISGPVIQRPNGVVKEEEGNMGKLTRIVKRSDIESIDEISELVDAEELKRYVSFIEYCQGKGIIRAGELYLKKKGFDVSSVNEEYLYKGDEMEFVMKGESEDEKILVFAGGRNIIRNGKLVSTKEKKILEKFNEENIKEAKFLIFENEEFNWIAGKIIDDDTEVRDRGNNIFGDVIGRQPI